MVFEKVKAIIVEQLDISEDKVEISSNIQDDLGADSLDVAELVMAFEDEFGIEIPEEQVENVKTVKDVVNFIKELTGDDEE